MSGGVTAASIAAAGIGAVGALQSANAQANAANYNAQIQQQNAQVSLQKANLASETGNIQAGQASLRGRAAVGAIESKAAASGLDTDSGSPQDVVASQRLTSGADIATIRANAARDAYGYQVQATTDTAQSQLDTYQAGQDMTSGYLNAGTDLAQGYYDYSKYGANPALGSHSGNNTTNTTPVPGTYSNSATVTA